jgi:hypothetical protein
MQLHSMLSPSRVASAHASQKQHHLNIMMRRMNILQHAPHEHPLAEWMQVLPVWKGHFRACWRWLHVSQHLCIYAPHQVLQAKAWYAIFSGSTHVTVCHTESALALAGHKLS